MRYKRTRRTGTGVKLKEFAPVNIDNAAVNCGRLSSGDLAIGCIAFLLKTLNEI